MQTTRPARDAEAIYAAGVRAADPRSSLAAALLDEAVPAGPVWILALGKAGPAMAAAAAETLDHRGTRLAGGLVVSHVPLAVPTGLTHVAGDHPLPGPRSLAAAERLAECCRRIQPSAPVRVLLSGGASSLVAAPVPGLPDDDFVALHRRLALVGLPIGRLNAVRKRFARFGAGRLRLAIPSEDVRVYCVSDVPGDDPRDIGSGPCEPDPSAAADIRAILAEAGLWEQLPPTVRSHLEEVEAGIRPETPKPGHAAFAGPVTRVVASNLTARLAAAAEARQRGYVVDLVDEVLVGDAGEAGLRLVTRLRERLGGEPLAVVLGGETTVALRPASGLGGRCQHLALTSALELERAGPAGAVVLAAGTDGRDGPTDAAGAVVDATTPSAIRAAGLDPEAALRRHDAYSALDAAGALLRTGPTGTNVMDLVIGLAPSR